MLSLIKRWFTKPKEAQIPVVPAMEQYTTIRAEIAGHKSICDTAYDQFQKKNITQTEWLRVSREERKLMGHLYDVCPVRPLTDEEKEEIAQQARDIVGVIEVLPSGEYVYDDSEFRARLDKKVEEVRQEIAEMQGMWAGSCAKALANNQV